MLHYTTKKLDATRTSKLKIGDRCERASDLVVLLCGGDKDTQETDIERAKIYWQMYLYDEQI